MIRKLVFLFIFFLFSFHVSAQSEKGKIYLQAQQLFQDEKYGLAQNLFHQIYMDEFTLESQKEEALLYIAICSKNLFNEDTKFWFDEFLNNYPYSEKTNEANYELALFYYRQKSYSESIRYFLKCEMQNSEFNFKLAYSYFMLDSLESSKYYFSKLLNLKTFFRSPFKLPLSELKSTPRTKDSPSDNISLYFLKLFSNITNSYIAEESEKLRNA